MAKFRTVNPKFWSDKKVSETFTPEDKLFMLYLLTNEHSTQLGIYSISVKLMAFELGYSKETICYLLERFENNYNIVRYSNETNEIAIKNFLKHSIYNGGKPVEDLLKKEVRDVKNIELLKYIYETNINNKNNNITLKHILEYIYNYINNNNNNNNESYHDSYHDSSNYNGNKLIKKNPKWLDKYVEEFEENVEDL